MTESIADTRLRVDGKFLRQGATKVFLRGISYGPFKTNSRGEPWPEDKRLIADLDDIHGRGFNTLRLYTPPSAALLSIAERLNIMLIVGIPWTDHLDFLRNHDQKQRIIEAVETVVTRLRDHRCVVAFFVGNEIEKTLVRWMVPRRVQHFLEQLIAKGKSCAPNQLFSYATYPSTEYLIPRNADFLAVNVYLEQPDALAAYLQRLQNLAGNKPLLITEFGLDVATHGEQAQSEAMLWFEQTCHRAAVAGTVWFSYTDEWFQGEVEVTQWKFGIVDAERRARPSALLLAPITESAKVQPRFSVIVCTFNGSATLRTCLASLQSLRYRDYEVLVIDDGSAQDIASITRDFTSVRYLRQEHAGLSVARNLGAAQATGEIIAYTDDDCIADEDWLSHLASGFNDPRWVACGGPNIPPPPRNRTEAIVAAAPGAPAHVLLSDIEAEHLPGCNLAIRKSALDSIGGFRALYRVAGDDVDICWRLREAGGHLHFLPGAMVWHHRRYTVRGYLRQQSGYGYAEALLMKAHPQRFGPIGGARWRGAIYSDLPPSADPAEGTIFHGPFGNGLFQGIYQHSHRCPLDWLSGVLWVALCIVSLLLGWQKIAVVVFALSGIAALCRLHYRAATPHALSIADKLRLLSLCWLQPMLRELARLKGMISLGARPSWQPTLCEVFEPAKLTRWSITLGEWAFWSEDGVGRDALMESLFKTAKQGVIGDDGWSRFDLETPAYSWFSKAILTATEYHKQNARLTRVRCMVRVRPLWALIFGPIILLLLGFIHYQLRTWIYKAAKESGLTLIKDS